jgi:GAF domain-containing protein
MLAALEHSLNKEREREKRHYTQNKTLAELAKRKMLEFSNLNARLSEITEAAAHTLKVERVSVWLYNDEQSKLRCINLYERSTNQHSEGIELEAASYPAYFQALKEDRTIAIDDAQNDSRTKELSRAYLSSSRVTSMLDAPVWLGGQW